MPLPRPTVRTDLHEGQGERKDGDGGTHLITSASGNKHHPVSQTQLEARPPLPPTVVLWSQKCNHKLLLDLHSQSTRTVHIQCHQLWANHLVHCRRRQG